MKHRLVADWFSFVKITNIIDKILSKKISHEENKPCASINQLVYKHEMKIKIIHAKNQIYF